MDPVGLVVKADADAIERADEFEGWLQARGHRVVRREGWHPATPAAVPNSGRAPADLRCVFVLGGDGTFLSAVRWIGLQDIPLLGVKFGEVGFLAEISEDRLLETARRVLDGACLTETRMRLAVHVLRDGRQRAAETVLNDVVINKGVLARLADMKTYIDDHYLTTYRADGLIIATPTGSTAYSLAAGGPVVHPSVPAIIMTPICPFTLTNRPLLVPQQVRISVRPSVKATDLQVTCDGQVGLKIDARDTLVVRQAACPLRLIRPPGQHYFDILKAKLRWSGGRV